MTPVLSRFILGGKGGGRKPPPPFFLHPLQPFSHLFGEIFQRHLEIMTDKIQHFFVSLGQNVEDVLFQVNHAQKYDFGDRYEISMDDSEAFLSA